MYGLVYRCPRCRIYFAPELGKHGCPNACDGRAARLVQAKTGAVLHGASSPNTQPKAITQ